MRAIVRFGGATGAPALAIAWPVAAQARPAKPLRMYNPVPPGGGFVEQDIVTRAKVVNDSGAQID